MTIMPAIVAMYRRLRRDHAVPVPTVPVSTNEAASRPEPVGRPWRTQTAGEAEVSCAGCFRWFKLTDLIDVDPAAEVTSTMVDDATKAHRCQGR